MRLAPLYLPANDNRKTSLSVRVRQVLYIAALIVASMGWIYGLCLVG